MPETHDSKVIEWAKGPLSVRLESLFTHAMRYPGRRAQRKLAGRPAPLWEPASPKELEEPWRTGRGRVVRVPGSRWAFVVGWWQPADPDDVTLPEEESDRLVSAINGAMLPIKASEIRRWGKVSDLTLFDRVLRWLAARYPKLGQWLTADTDYEIPAGSPDILPAFDGYVRPEDRPDEWWGDTPILDLEEARAGSSPPREVRSRPAETVGYQLASCRACGATSWMPLYGDAFPAGRMDDTECGQCHAFQVEAHVVVIPPNDPRAATA